MKKCSITLPFTGIFQIGIGSGAAKHVLFAGIFVVANKELEAESGDAFQRVTDAT